ncbi:single-stranded-DNA-specific exonuclease RecJ [Galbibacter sp.]|uniref:single-stranded-DNA-specific exonuclease RecJ n=1 Tax=Galbibacter sp. TaxID=2918471 RepID=UPI002D1FA51B|nr:single-stranded-DNA-specific exonuclease RecJ [Galbibacter sp.]
MIRLANHLNVDHCIASLLIQRGVKDFDQSKAFFRPSLDDLHDPFLMKDMQKAVNRIQKAIENKEHILIYGDYDVDGTTSVALLYSYLSESYSLVSTYIPDRYKEGYGVSYAGIDYAKSHNYSLIIALDCGIKAIDKVAYAKEKGIDFIICDHHRPGLEIPDAIAVLDPKQEDCPYPYKELCGCGVGFKLIQALSQKSGKTTEDIIPYLDFVATAIGADIVPITGENRVLAHFGMKQINNAPRVGFKALTPPLDRPISMTDVIFKIAPRINAAGRMEHASYAVEILIEQRLEKAMEMAQGIETFNSSRKDLDKEITKAALEQIIKNKEEDNASTVVYDPSWHKGVIGIVASRLTETYYRPTLVFTKSGDKLAASARSVKGFDIYNALEACCDCIEQFGGHKYAAGLTLRADQFMAFKEKFEKVVRETIDKHLLIPEIKVDLKIDFNDITPKFYRILKQFAPYGPGNAIPVFLTQNLIDTGGSRCVGQENAHLKLSLAQSDGVIFDGIAFGLGDKLPLLKNNQPVDILYTIDENYFNGKTSLQLIIRDIKPTILNELNGSNP